jgi:putative membrane protein
MKPGDEASQSELPANIQTHLAWLRTRMSVERTLEAWIRTAAALIGFGFTIVQFFEHFNQMEDVVPPKGPHLARYVGLLLIGIGTLALGIAVSQYQKMVKHLRSETFRGIAGVPGMPNLYPSVTAALLLCLVGLLAFITILARAALPSSGNP